MATSADYPERQEHQIITDQVIALGSLGDYCIYCAVCQVFFLEVFFSKLQKWTRKPRHIKSC